MKVLSGQGIGIFSVFPKFEASLFFVDKLKIQWAKENGYVIVGIFTYEREKFRFQASSNYVRVYDSTKYMIL